MKPIDCELESEVLAAVLQNRWPERVDASLREMGRPGAHRASAHDKEVGRRRDLADRLRPGIGDAHRACRPAHGVRVRICVVAASTAALLNGRGTVLPARYASMRSP